MSESSRLVMSQGPQPGQTFTLDQERITLGRDPSSDIMISDPQVSRQHARLTRQDEMIVIEDLGSTNGTFVNGMRLTGPHTLVNSDVIGLGDVATLTYYGVNIATTEPLAGQPTVSAMPPSPKPPSSLPPQAAPPLDYATTPPPPPAYASAPPPAKALGQKKDSKTGLWVGCGCLALLLACVAVGLFLWFAPASFWQALIDLGIPVPAWPF
jgi:predicted component of type VI protein secretion system